MLLALQMFKFRWIWWSALSWTKAFRTSKKQSWHTEAMFLSNHFVSLSCIKAPGSNFHLHKYNRAMGFGYSSCLPTFNARALEFPLQEKATMCAKNRRLLKVSCHNDTIRLEVTSPEMLTTQNVTRCPSEFVCPWQYLQQTSFWIMWNEPSQSK